MPPINAELFVAVPASQPLKNSGLIVSGSGAFYQMTAQGGR